MAKAPVAGQVKTRLCPPLSPAEAAAVAEGALADTLAAVALCGADRRILALDGAAGEWLPPGFIVIPQRGLGLAARLAAAWHDADGPGLQIGMDTPQVTAPLLDACLAATAAPALTATLGRAADGGWWALGLCTGWGRDVFAGVPMSAPVTAERQRASLQAHGHRVGSLVELRDVDTIDDAVAVARQVPAGRFAAVWRAISARTLACVVISAGQAATWRVAPSPAPRPLPVGWPDHLFEARVATPYVELETEDGETTVVDCARWHLPADRVDMALLARCRGPVLDIGCGPGRHVAALVNRGCHALGIDASPTAVAATKRRGAPATEVSVFGPVPDAGQWGTVLLLDGNIGIGGDVTRLLRRASHLLMPTGRVLVELDSPTGRPSGSRRVRLRHQGYLGEWFPWAWVSPAEIVGAAETAGLTIEDRWHLGGRWFARLDRPVSERRS